MPRTDPGYYNPNNENYGLNPQQDPGHTHSQASLSLAGFASTPPATVTTPGVPGTTTPQANNTGLDVMVYITGGTVTVIAIGSNTTGLTSGSFYLASGQSITLTYSSAPSWKWVPV